MSRYNAIVGKKGLKRCGFRMIAERFAEITRMDNSIDWNQIAAADE